LYTIDGLYISKQTIKSIFIYLLAEPQVSYESLVGVSYKLAKWLQDKAATGLIRKLNDAQVRTLVVQKLVMNEEEEDEAGGGLEEQQVSYVVLTRWSTW